MRNVGRAIQGRAVRRGLATLMLTAAIGMAPMVALASDPPGATMAGTTGTTQAPWQLGNAQGDGNGR